MVALLLAAGTAGAETATYMNKDGKQIIVTCEPGYPWSDNSCRLIPEPPCYQRMREAMRVMDRWLDEAKLGNLSFQGGVYPNVKRHWDDVMKECVK